MVGFFVPKNNDIKTYCYFLYKKFSPEFNSVYMYVEEKIYMKLKGNHETAFTSVHVFRDKYQTFKQLGVASGMTLQKLVNRCVYLYANDVSFREKVDKTNDLQPSGSAF